ncbi:MAG: hypothetical protein MJ137_01615 [Clostridia bacterium]|nr:hypothetical protein [Clostridia bacterium]
MKAERRDHGMSENVIYNGFEDSFRTLKDRFDGRGLEGSYITEASEYERRELRNRLENPGAGRLDDIMRQDFSNRYRTGRADGRAFMTVEDFLHLSADERAFRDSRMGAPVRNLEREQAARRISTAARPAHPYTLYEVKGVEEQFENTDGNKALFFGRRETVYDGGYTDAGRRAGTAAAVAVSGGESEMMVRPVGRAGFLGNLKEQFFRKDLIAETDKRPANSNGLYAALAIVAVFMLVLALPITLSVMKHSAATAVSRLESQIRDKEAQKIQLGIELEQKNDLFLLESLAVEKYGMVELDKSVYTMIKINPEDSVEHSEDEKSGGVMPALLSALGLRASK